MDRKSNIQMKMRVLLSAMYELGKEESKGDILLIQEEAHTKGFDAGYEAAMEEHRMPDL